jgi:hypothetical protein
MFHNRSAGTPVRTPTLTRQSLLPHTRAPAHKQPSAHYFNPFCTLAERLGTKVWGTETARAHRKMLEPPPVKPFHCVIAVRIGQCTNQELPAVKGYLEVLGKFLVSLALAVVNFPRYLSLSQCGLCP